MKMRQFSFLTILILGTCITLGLSPILKGSATPLKVAQSAEVKGADVKCDNPNVNTAVPDVKVSAPNPSRLVPNVGRILREGVGVPAPDSEAPDVSAKAQASSPAKTCASNTTSSASTSSPSNTQDEQSMSGSINGLW
jgi:hypothetical protein